MLNDDSEWFSSEFELKSLEILDSSNVKKTQKLKEILIALKALNPWIFKNLNQNIHFKTKLEFQKEWGLGSSSTLISLLSQFARIDPYKLNELTFSTSGYDIACATIKKPIIYRNTNELRKIEVIDFQADFRNQLYFVYLNKKQDTQKSVSTHYLNLEKDSDWINRISTLSHRFTKAQTMDEFEEIIDQQEDEISSKLKLPKVKDLYFSDYAGSVKSLGAWGGDFVMVTAREGFREYFESKGLHTILGFDQLFLT